MMGTHTSVLLSMGLDGLGSSSESFCFWDCDMFSSYPSFLGFELHMGYSLFHIFFFFLPSSLIRVMLQKRLLIRVGYHLLYAYA
ncbi:hypothetical protein CPC08DRAFT_104482 [Agrocybe pediades]|nr:hypothetical protein CPC08DRAFT_104482 [Agrocybe pediades]